MNTAHPRLLPLAWKTVVVHTVTCFLLGVIAYLVFDYPTKFADPRYSGVIRPLDHPLVIAGPLFQPLRGLVFALVFYPLREVLFRKPRGWLLLWWTLLVLGILNTFGPAPCSTEGMNDRHIKTFNPAVVPGIAVFGCFVTGLLSLGAALWALSKDQTIGAGVCLMAAALAFGFVVYVSFGD